MLPEKPLTTHMLDKKPLHVAMLIWSYWPGHEGGAERQCRKIIPYLLREGLQVTVVTARTAKAFPVEEGIDGYRIIRLGGLIAIICTFIDRVHAACTRWPVGGGRSPRTEAMRKEALKFWLCLPLVLLHRIIFLWALRNWLRTSAPKPDVIHVHESSWLAGAAAGLAVPMGIQVLAKTAIYPAWNKLGYDVPFRRILSEKRRLCHFAALSGYLADDLVVNGIPEKAIFRVPNGVEIPESVLAEARSSKALMVANFSQGVEHKAFDVMLEAWSRVVIQVPDAELVLLGDGDRGFWEEMVSNQGLQNHVRFMGWVASPEEHYRQAALFVLPSRMEGLSNALLEAQSYGLPCVVSDIRGNLAVVEDGVNGLVVPVGDAQALAEAILRLLGDSALCSLLGKCARQSARERFSLDAVAGRLTGIYKQLVATPAN
jgi:glycosyltransferase involved in cell wall biosynthesis